MRCLTRDIIVFGILFQGLFGQFSERSGDVWAQQISKAYPQTSSLTLPEYRLRRKVSPFDNLYDPRSRRPLPFVHSKLRFTPVKILGTVLQTPHFRKELPRLSRTFDRQTPLPEELPNKTQTGLVVELESAYGTDNTFVGRLQHGTQFETAHYFVDGHWESTDGAHKKNQEETFTGQLKVNIDLSRSSKIAFNGSYFQSDIALPQLQGQRDHQKSAIQINAAYQVNFEPDLNASTTLSWQQAHFTDHGDATFSLNGYRALLTLKKIWSAKNTVSLYATGSWEEFFQGREHLEDRYHGTATAVNSFAMHNLFSVDTGIRYDYYHSNVLSSTESFIAPILTARFHLFQHTSLYATYHPRLKFPEFTDLYIRNLYTTVNPALRAEKIQHYFESGIKQRLGESVTMNIGLFYHDSQHSIFQIDANNDNILEYEQLEAVDFMGVKASVQINYRKQFVQNIAYTYAKHHIFSEQRFQNSNDELRNQILTYQPDHQVQASVYWKTPFGLTLELSGTYVSEQFRNRSLTQGLIGKRFFVNADITQRLTENVQAFLLGRNLTDINTYDIIPLLDSEEITSSRLIIGGIRLRF